MILDNGVIRTGDVLVLWDGITRPDAIDAKDGKPASQKFSLKVAFAPDSQTYAELYSEVAKFKAAKFPNGVPDGWDDAFYPAKVDELPGHIAVNGVTYGTAPDIYDTSGRLLSAAECTGKLYAGAKVQVLLQPREYNNKSKGFGFWLNGLLIVDTSAPKLSIASGVDARSAFGLPATPLGGTPAPVGGAPVPPAQPAAVAAPAPVSSPQPPAPAGIAASATTYPSNVAVVPNPGILAAPPAPAPVPVAPAAPVRTMTPAAVAAGYTYEALAAAGWSDQQMIQGGYLAPM